MKNSKSVVSKETMYILDIVHYCYNKNWKATAHYFCTLLSEDVYKGGMIDAKIVRQHFMAGESDFLFREMQCHVSTFINFNN
jgi:hypothetical protein